MVNLRINIHRWSALIVTLFVTIIICLIAVYLLDKIMPISKNVKWIENSNIAYYNASSWIEEALLFMSWDNPWVETWTFIWNTYWNWIGYSVIASWTTIPLAWEWNSNYNWNYNKIWPGEPLQLVINNNSLDWSSINFSFKAPDLDLDWDWNLETLTWSAGSWIINWVLSWKNSSWTWVSLMASWETNMITVQDINESLTDPVYLGSKEWLDLNWSWATLSNFYNRIGIDWPDCNNYKCTLKLSLINNKIELDYNTVTGWLWVWEAWGWIPTAPYLEYKIEWLNSPIPLQYAIIKADWYSNWFKKSIRKDVRQTTTSEVLDFTIFQ